MASEHGDKSESGFKMTPADAAEYLKGIDFPADRSKIVQYAQSHQAPDKLVDILERIPETEYRSMADVFHGWGQTGENK